MTLANTRENGVRSLSVTCELCRHEALMNVDAFGDATPVPALAPAWSAPAAESSAHTRGQIEKNDRSERAGRAYTGAE
jgi:hypothetical protein